MGVILLFDQYLFLKKYGWLFQWYITFHVSFKSELKWCIPLRKSEHIQFQTPSKQFHDNWSN